MTRIRTIALIGLIMLMSACTSSAPTLMPIDAPTEEATDAPTGEVVEARLERSLNPDASPEALAAISQSNTEFAFDLYHQTAADHTDNVIFSPYSISLAFAMVYAGARGETETQIAEVLHYSLPQDQLHPAYNALDLQLVGTGEAPTPAPEGEETGDLILRIANAIWGQEGLAFNQAFLDTLGVNYGAGLRLMDFVGAPNESREEINQWVEDQTEERIKDLIPDGVITPDTRLVLTNAIYFYGGWTSVFYPEATQDAPFTTLAGDQVTVPLMSQGGLNARYASGDGYQVLELPYGVNQDAAMLIILPDAARFSEFEASVDAAQFNTIRESMQYKSVNVWLPKWDFESEFSLKDTLIAMGMQAPFGEGAPADFSGITDEIDLVLSDVIHKANITVDEEGTEAAAATAIIMAESAAMEPEDPVEFRADHPFIFAIYDTDTGTLLFLGRVTDPSAP
jgi:serpin B